MIVDIDLGNRVDWVCETCLKPYKLPAGAAIHHLCDGPPAPPKPPLPVKAPRIPFEARVRPAAEKAVPLKHCGPGCWLTKLVGELGIHYRPGCKCKFKAGEMDRWGVQWCRANIETILDSMRTEAEKQSLAFIDSQARWLVTLAIELAAEQREPTWLERSRLLAMKTGNLILNGKGNSNDEGDK